MPDWTNERWEPVSRLTEVEKYFCLRPEDEVKVEIGNTFDAYDRPQEKVLVEIIRPIGKNKYFYSQMFTPAEFKKADAGLDFINEANKYFWEIANGKQKKGSPIILPDRYQ